MLQKRFCDSDGKIYLIGTDPRKVVRLSPQNLFVESRLYAYQERDGTRDVELERWFSRLEGEVDPLISRLLEDVRHFRVPDLDTSQKHLWDLFLFSQVRRVPDFHRQHNLREEVRIRYAQAVGELKEKRPELIEELRPFESASEEERFYRNAVVQNLRDFSGPAYASICARGLAIIHIPPRARKSFILGSSPALFLVGGLLHPESEIWLPVAPDTLFGINPRGGEVELMFLEDHREIRRINEGIAAQSSQIAGPEPKLLLSLRNKR